MAERRAGEMIQQTGTAMKRRGLLAGAAALVAGIAAKQMAQPVAAASDTQFTATGAGSGNADFDARGTATYALDTINGSFSTAVWARGTTYGVYGTATGFGVYGTATGGSSAVGVYGSTPDTGVGVYGTNQNGYGVYGICYESGFGVYGVSANNIGVRGEIPVASSTANTKAVYGINQSSGTGGSGVVGKCDTATGIGVQGQSNLGVGVFGVSNGNAGVLGSTTAPGNVGVGGIANIAGTAAFAGTSTNPNAFAGFFTGDVFVNGNFTVNDPTRKHGAIQHPDGSLRLLYSMESPESWLEDFGKGQLVGGKATVTLDPDFAAVVHAEDYHIFLTTYGMSQGLDVTAQSATGFAVQERNNGTSAIRFGYRVVAKPKTTNKAARLAKFAVPDIRVPHPPPMPNVPAATVPDVPLQAAPPSRPAPSSVSPAAAPSQGSGTAQGGTTNPVQPMPSSR
jgi:hypothetical protein